MAENPHYSTDSPSVGPKFAFFKTVAGPDDTPYPTAGANVFYARMVDGVTFTREAGTQLISSTNTDIYDWVCNLIDGDFISEGTLIAAMQMGGRWWTWDKVPCTGCADGPIFAMGGGQATNGENHNFNPTTNVWKEKTQLPLARYYSTGFWSPNFAGAYLFGGVNGVDNLDRVDLYAGLGTDAWAAKTSMPDPIGMAPGAAISLKCYIFRNGLLSNQRHFAYDTAADSHASKALDFQLYASFGTRLGFSDGSYFHVACGPAFSDGIISVPGGVHKRFDPSANTWTSRADLPTYNGTGEYQFQGQAWVLGSKSHIVGAYIGGGATDAHQQYDFTGNSWSTGASMTHGAASPGATVADGVGYVTGGASTAGGTHGLPYTQAFDGSAWAQKSPMLQPARDAHSCVTL